MLDRPALSVQGVPDDLWVAGGSVDTGALAAHWDGAAWTRHAPAGSHTWWWVWTSPSKTVWLVGSEGTVARRSGAGWTVEQLGSPELVLYGVWGSADDDVWIVGGVPGGGADPEDGFVRRWNGSAFVEPAVPSRGVTLFKVWGAAAADLWISGEGGTLWRWTGDAGGFIDHTAELATFSPALTVHGCSAGRVYAVAGQRLYELSGATWRAADVPVLPSVANGVSCGPGGVVVVGNAGLKRRWPGDGRPSGPGLDERNQPPTFQDLHGALVDDAGRGWAVGGNFNAPSPATRTGVVGVFGCPKPVNL
jgi:hypothetical protein